MYYLKTVKFQSGPGEIGLFQYMLKVMPDSVQQCSHTNMFVQVPKMEVLNLIRLLGGVGFPMFCLT